MTPSLHPSTVVANALSSNISSTLMTWQAAVYMGGRLDRGYLFGIFVAHHATAKALGLPWSNILADSLCDLEELNALLLRTQDLGSKPLIHLVAEIETELLGSTPGPRH